MLISPPFSTFIPVPSFPFHPPSSTSCQFVSPTRVTRCLSVTHTQPSLPDTNARSEAKPPEWMLDCLFPFYAQTRWPMLPDRVTGKHGLHSNTNTEPHTPSNAGANVTLQILSFPLSCSWSVRRVWHSEGIDSRGRFTLALTRRLAFKYMHTGPHTHTLTHPLVAWDVVQILLNDPEPIPATEPGVFCSWMVSGTFRSQVIMRS